MRVGLVAPASTYLPKLGASLLQSLEHGLGGNAEVVVETTKHNEDTAALHAVMQRFGLDPQIEVVVAPLNTGIVRALLPAATAQELCLVALTGGEDLAFDEHPLLFTHSFGLWQSAWLAGYTGARKHGPKVVNSAALHDSGYGMLFAHGLGVEAASGHIVATTQTHVNAADESPRPALDTIVETDPDVVFGLYSGRESTSFLEHWLATSALAGKPLMWLPPMTVGPSTNLRSDAPLATSIGRWSPHQDHAFHDWHVEHLGRPPTAYAVLAYEAGLLIAAAVDARSSDSLADLQTALGQATCTGPRGNAAFNDNASSGFSTYEVTTNADGQLVQRPISPVESPALLAEQMCLAAAKIGKAGWLNPYLIA